MARRRIPLPVRRLEAGGVRVDIYAPRDGIWAIEVSPAEPLRRVNVAVRSLKAAEMEARRLLPFIQSRRIR